MHQGAVGGVRGDGNGQRSREWNAKRQRVRKWHLQWKRVWFRQWLWQRRVGERNGKRRFRNGRNWKWWLWHGRIRNGWKLDTDWNRDRDWNRDWNRQRKRFRNRRRLGSLLLRVYLHAYRLGNHLFGRMYRRPC